MSGRGKDDWRLAIECLMDSDDLVGFTSQCRCHSRFSSHSLPCGRLHLQMRRPDEVMYDFGTVL